VPQLVACGPFSFKNQLPYCDTRRVLTGALLALLGIAAHIRIWKFPRIQVYYLRMLLIVPLLFIFSFFSLVFPRCHSTFVFGRTWYVLAAPLGLCTFAYHVHFHACCSVLSLLVHTYVELLQAYFAPHFTQQLRYPPVTHKQFLLNCGIFVHNRVHVHLVEMASLSLGHSVGPLLNQRHCINRLQVVFRKPCEYVQSARKSYSYQLMMVCLHFTLLQQYA
jgi:hypothetical protein